LNFAQICKTKAEKHRSQEDEEEGEEEEEEQQQKHCKEGEGLRKGELNLEFDDLGFYQLQKDLTEL
jgi:hypothetical protein